MLTSYIQAAMRRATYEILLDQHNRVGEAVGWSATNSLNL